MKIICPSSTTLTSSLCNLTPPRHKFIRLCMILADIILNFFNSRTSTPMRIWKPLLKKKIFNRTAFLSKSRRSKTMRKRMILRTRIEI